MYRYISDTIKAKIFYPQLLILLHLINVIRRTLRLYLGYQGGLCPDWDSVTLWWSLPADWPAVRPLRYPPTVIQSQYR